jgi:hypothetical protein
MSQEEADVPKADVPKADVPKADVPSEEERGSASSEFILFALPLFLPLIVLFMALNRSASIEIKQEMIARELLATFVSSRDDSSAFSRANFLLDKYRQEDQKLTEMKYAVRCQLNPCIQPGAAVEITITSVALLAGIPGDEELVLTTSAQGYVDKWGQ